MFNTRGTHLQVKVYHFPADTGVSTEALEMRLCCFSVSHRSERPDSVAGAQLTNLVVIQYGHRTNFADYKYDVF